MFVHACGTTYILRTYTSQETNLIIIDMGNISVCQLYYPYEWKDIGYVDRSVSLCLFFLRTTNLGYYPSHVLQQGRKAFWPLVQRPRLATDIHMLTTPPTSSIWQLRSEIDIVAVSYYTRVYCFGIIGKRARCLNFFRCSRKSSSACYLRSSSFHGSRETFFLPLNQTTKNHASLSLLSSLVYWKKILFSLRHYFSHKIFTYCVHMLRIPLQPDVRFLNIVRRRLAACSLLKH